MASTIKVDQIQLSDGSTPTAADLGIDVASGDMPEGVIVQVQTTVNRSTASATSNTFVNSGCYVDFTPKFSDSTIIVHAQGHVWRNASGHNWFRVINQSSGTASGNRGGRDQYSGYHESVPVIWKDTSHASTSQRRYEIQIANRDNNGTPLNFNDGGSYESGITVFEIK